MAGECNQGAAAGGGPDSSDCNCGVPDTRAASRVLGVVEHAFRRGFRDRTAHMVPAVKRSVWKNPTVSTWDARGLVTDTRKAATALISSTRLGAGCSNWSV